MKDPGTPDQTYKPTININWVANSLLHKGISMQASTWVQQDYQEPLTPDQTNKQTSQKIYQLGSKYLVLNNQQSSIIYVKKEKNINQVASDERASLTVDLSLLVLSS